MLLHVWRVRSFLKLLNTYMLLILSGAWCLGYTCKIIASKANTDIPIPAFYLLLSSFLTKYVGIE